MSSSVALSDFACAIAQLCVEYATPVDALRHTLGVVLRRTRADTEDADALWASKHVFSAHSLVFRALMGCDDPDCDECYNDACSTTHDYVRGMFGVRAKSARAVREARQREAAEAGVDRHVLHAAPTNMPQSRTHLSHWTFSHESVVAGARLTPYAWLYVFVACAVFERYERAKYKCRSAVQHARFAVVCYALCVHDAVVERTAHMQSTETRVYRSLHRTLRGGVYESRSHGHLALVGGDGQNAVTQSMLADAPLEVARTYRTALEHVRACHWLCSVRSYVLAWNQACDGLVERVTLDRAAAAAAAADVHRYAPASGVVARRVYDETWLVLDQVTTRWLATPAPLSSMAERAERHVVSCIAIAQKNAHMLNIVDLDSADEAMPANAVANYVHRPVTQPLNAVGRRFDVAGFFTWRRVCSRAMRLETERTESDAYVCDVRRCTCATSRRGVCVPRTREYAFANLAELREHIDVLSAHVALCSPHATTSPLPVYARHAYESQRLLVYDDEN